MSDPSDRASSHPPCIHCAAPTRKNRIKVRANGDRIREWQCTSCLRRFILPEDRAVPLPGTPQQRWNAAHNFEGRPDRKAYKAEWIRKDRLKKKNSTPLDSDL